MKKIKRFYLLATLVCACLLGGVACTNNQGESNDEPSSGDSSIVQTETVTMAQFETMRLESDMDGETTWASSETSVIKVVDGFIYALSEGKSTVTATTGTTTEEWKITVVASEYYPVFALDKNETVIRYGDKMTINPKLTLNGKAVKIESLDAVSEDESKVKSTVEDGQIILESKAIVEDLTVMVTAQYFGIEFEKSLTVSVVEDVAIDLSADEISLFTYDANGALNEEGYVTTDTLIAEVYQNGQKVRDAEIVFTSENDRVATVDEQGVINMVATGTTVVKASWTSASGITYDAKCNVTVAEPYIIRETVTELYLRENDGDTVVDLVGDYAAVIDGIDMQFADITDGEPQSISATKISTGYRLDRTALKAGERKIKAYAEGKLTYEFPVIVVSKIITTAEELQNLTDYGTVVNYPTTGEYPLYTFDGYFVLGRNIDLTGIEIISTFDAGENKGEYGFIGTFDGRGYTILNGTYSGHGLFGQVGAAGVVKNVAFTNMTITSGCSGIANFYYGSMENVLLSMTEIFGATGIAWAFQSGATFTNVVAYSTGNAGDSHPYCLWAGNLGTYTNCYSISEDGCMSYAAQQSDSVTKLTWENCAAGVFEALDEKYWVKTSDGVTFKSYVDFAQDKLDEVDLSGLPEKLFAGQTIAFDGLPEGAKLTTDNENLTIDGTALCVSDEITEVFSCEITITYLTATRTVEFMVVVPEKITVDTVYEYVIFTGRNGNTPIANTEAFTIDIATSLNGKTLTNGDWGLYNTSKYISVDSLVTMSGTVITFNPVTIAGGEYTLSCISDELLVEIPIRLISKVITTKDDLQSMKLYGKVEGDTTGDTPTYTFDGYFVLGANIDLTGETVATAFNTAENVSKAVGFIGTFDGRGYALQNGTYAQQGLFGQLGETGVVKNVAILNATLTYTGTVAYMVYGTLQDVLITCTESYYAWGIAFGFGATAKLTNVVAYSTGNAGDSHPYCLYGGDSATYTNCYSISEDGLMCYRAQQSDSVTKMTWENVSKGSFTGFDETMWKFNDDGTATFVKASN